MQRSFLVEPDTLAKLEDGSVVPAISQGALVKALYDLAILIDRGGGHGSIATMRKRTPIENVSATTEAIIQWRDRADARPQPERPEPAPAALDASTNGIANPQNGSASDGQAATAHADLQGELEEPVGEPEDNGAPMPPANHGENGEYRGAGMNGPETDAAWQQQASKRTAPQNEVRIMSAEETAALHRGVSSDPDLVDESEVPAKYRG
jgi:hypothetical protein